MWDKFFTINSVKYEYSKLADSPRDIEVPFVLAEVEKYKPEDVLEIGYVIPSHYCARHIVIDKYEVHPNNSRLVNIDIVDFVPDKKYKLIVSISTFEHIGWDYGEGVDRNKPFVVMDLLKSFLKPEGMIIITVPVGWPSELEYSWDDFGFTKTFCMKRTSIDNKWVETTWDDIIGRQWGNPFPCANALLIGVYNE